MPAFDLPPRRRVVVGVLDTGFAPWALLPASRVSGDPEGFRGHGSYVVATIAALAPEAEIRVVSIHPGVVTGLRNPALLGASFVTCAWSVPSSPALLAARATLATPLLVSLTAGSGRRFPCKADRVVGVPDHAPWPRGACRPWADAAPWSGPSLATAVAAAVAARLVAAGAPVMEALQWVAAPTPSLPALQTEVAS